MSRRNVLIMDPERDIGEFFARALESQKESKCYLASTEHEAFDLLGDISFDIMLADMGALMAEDFSLLKRIRRVSPNLTIIVDAYLHQREFITRALSLGAHGYFIKPIKLDMFRKKIEEFACQCESAE